MTRRIAAAILLTVWAVLVTGGVAAYWVTRAVLVRDLDHALARASATLPQAAARPGAGDTGAPAAVHPEDRYVVKNALGQTVASPAARSVPAAAKSLPPYTAAFAPLGDGRRVRTVTVSLPPDDSDAGSAVTVVYSRPTDSLDRVLGTLALALTVCGVTAGAAAAAVAVAVARAALRPLHAAADVVGVIDEQKLDRRIDAESLPEEMHPAALRLNGMLERLERAFAERRRFLADAAHELRTPVAALVTTLEVALRRKRDRDASDLVRTLEACLGDARYLRRLVTTLLEHARGEARRSSPDPQLFDAADVFDTCADAANALGAAGGVTVVRSYEGPLPVVTEPDRLRGVVTNLLANAVAFSPPGSAVELSALIDGGALHVSVRDAGPGIAPEHLPNLFQPFYRAQGAHWGTGAGASAPGGGNGSTAGPETLHEVPHLGLGLFIVDAHVRALGGRCTVASTVGVGTTVHVVFPGAGASPPRDSINDAGTEKPEPDVRDMNTSAPIAVLEAGGAGR